MKVKLWLMFFILSATVFLLLRLFNLDNRMSFDRDYERDALAVWRILIDKKPMLLGHQADNEKGFFMAPFHFYTLAPFYLVNKMNPLTSMRFFIWGHNIFFLTILFLGFRRIFGNKKTFILMTLLAVNPLLVGFQAMAWNPAVIPTGVLLFWILFYLCQKTDKIRFYFLLGFITGIFIHYHFLFAFQALAVFFLFSRDKDFIKRASRLMILVLALSLTFLPVVIFDLRNDFLNLKILSTYFSQSPPTQNRQYIPGFSFATYFDPLTTSFFPLNMKLGLSIFFYIASGASLLFFSLRNRGFERDFWRGNLIIWLTTGLFFFFYKGTVSEYYFLYILMVMSFVLMEYLSRLQLVGAFLVFGGLIFGQALALKNKIFSYEGYNLRNKIAVVQKLKLMAKDTPVYVGIDTPLGLNHGFTYLFKYYQVNKSESPKVPLYIIKAPSAENAIFKAGEFSLIPPKNHKASQTE